MERGLLTSKASHYSVDVLCGVRKQLLLNRTTSRGGRVKLMLSFLAIRWRNLAADQSASCLPETIKQVVRTGQD